jgi:ribonuclease D
VQLSTLHSNLVIQLARKNGKVSTACGPLLAAVLRDESIVKVGCGIDQDLLQLRSQWHKMEARSRLDLSVVFRGGGNTLGLKTLARHTLGIDLPKKRSITISNWSCIPLTDRQLHYAARDAWAGAAIAHALERRYMDTFSPAQLRQSLRHQSPLSVLQHKVQRRQHAKRLIQTLLLPYQSDRTIVPDWKLTLVRELRQVAKESLLDPMEPILDAADIGIIH